MELALHFNKNWTLFLSIHPNCPSITANQQMIQQHSTYSYMSKDSYMFLLLNKATIRLLIKESRKATLQLQFVDWYLKLYSTVLQEYTVCDLKLQTAVVNIASLISFTYSLIMATVYRQNMQLSFDI